MMCLVSLSLAQSGNVKEIVVSGNVNIPRNSILTAMETKEGQPFNAAVLDNDKRAIEALGYFQAVDTQAKMLDDGTWSVLVNVSEFPVVREIRLLGNNIVSREEILEAMPIKVGQVFNVTLIQPSVEAIREVYSKKGYFMQPEDFSLLQDAPDVLNISLVEFTVGEIRILGLTRTRENVIRRLLKTKPGDPFNARQWERDLGRVFYSTQWFETVEPEVEQSDEIGKVNLIVKVTEGRTGIFNVGVQLDPRSSFAGVIRVADTNFRGSGQSIGLNYLQATSGAGASIDLDYSNPVIDNRGSVLSASIYSRVLYRFQGSLGGSISPTDDNRYTERRTGASVSLTRPIKDDTLFGTIQLRAENIKTEDLNTTAVNNFIQQDGDLAILALGVVLNNRDVDVDPSRGNWARLLIEPGYSNITRVGGQASNSNILGANTFLRNSLEYRQYLSPDPPRGLKLDEPRRVLALRARIGAINGEVPFFEQFFVGGSDTLRGYAEDRFWGTQFASFTAEYRHPIQKAFNVIAFVDYAGAWGGYGGVNEFTQSNRFNMHLGYGVGASFRTPLGQIRIDLGFNETGGSRTHLLIGTSF